MSSPDLLTSISNISERAAAVAQWILCSAADPKDDGSILPAAVAFRWRRSAVEARVLCMRTPSRRNYPKPSTTTSLIARVTLVKPHKTIFLKDGS